MKERILNDIQDLIKTLQGPNIKDANVLRLWREKAEKVMKDFKGLSNVDIAWLMKEYQVWHSANVQIDNNMVDLVGEDFPWI